LGRMSLFQKCTGVIRKHITCLKACIMIGAGISSLFTSGVSRDHGRVGGAFRDAGHLSLRSERSIRGVNERANGRFMLSVRNVLQGGIPKLATRPN
jgi:hypothetical protein